MGRNTQTTSEAIAGLRAQYENLKAQIQELGFVMQGSVVKRTTKCNTPTCQCQRGKEYEHGPYYQWTTKVKGKTVTRRLSPEEAKGRRQYIANGRQLKKLLARMYKLSEKVVIRTNS